MKVTRCVLKIVAALAVLAAVACAVACAVAAYWDRIVDAFYTVADKIEEKKASCCFESSEYDDYDDDDIL